MKSEPLPFPSETAAAAPPAGRPSLHKVLPENALRPSRRSALATLAGLVACAALAIGSSGCTPPPGAANGGAATGGSAAAATSASTNATPVPKGKVLRVAAAADLRFALPEVAAAFEQEHPYVKIEPTFAASGALFAQISQKAPFDLFLSADLAFPAKLIADGRAASKKVETYALGRLVLWVAKDSPLPVEDGWKVLSDERVKKIALANPATAPYGRAAKAALEKHGLYKELEAKIVLGDNVGQAFQFVESGVAQVGIVAHSLASAPAAAEKGRAWLVPQEDHPPLLQGAIVLSPSEEAGLAEKFLQFLLSAQARAILERNGLAAPPEGALPPAAPPKSDDAKAAEAKAAEAKAAEAKAVDSKAVDSKVVEAKPAEPKSVEPKP